MQKKIVAVILMLLVFSLTACAQATTPAQVEEPAATHTPVPTEESAEDPTVAPTAEAAEEPAEVAATPVPVQESAPADEVGARTFAIVSERSEVRFVIDEVLRGSPKTVIGANNQVTGQVNVDAANPASTEIGAIQINAATFVTDDNMRNGAIRRFILQTGQFPTIDFTPTATTGLPSSAAIGDSFDFQVTGDLTILDRTNPVTFDLTATVVSENEIEISGGAAINRADFNLNIPSVPFVANVGESLAIELDLVAVAAE